MFGLALTNDAHMRSKNGLPHQNTTGVASASSIQFTRVRPRPAVNEPDVAMSPIASRKTGRPSATPNQKRRVMSANSGLGASSAIAVMSVIIGSSAIPHFGQAPGRSLTISGCIGQVYLGAGGWGLAAGGWRLRLAAPSLAGSSGERRRGGER